MSLYVHYNVKSDGSWAKSYAAKPWTPEAEALSEAVTTNLLAAPWKFAKTMPENPHWYTLRYRWAEVGLEDEFTQAVLFVREYGYVRWFWGKPYIQMDIADHFYWCMGAPPGETELINRKPFVLPPDFVPPT